MKQDFNLAGSEVEKKASEHRCDCGQLLARIVPQGVELKCKRCKRLSVIAFTFSNTH